MRVKDVPIGDIRPYENNPRRNDDAVGYVENSIREFGFKQPIVCDADGTIIAGHTRYKAAKRLGLDTVPVVYATDLTPEQVNAYRLADNKVAEAATWDESKLAAELDGLLGFDMEQFGFSDFDFEDEEFDDDQVEEDGYEDDVEEPICKRGDVWVLGDHRLMCGDSTSGEDVSKLMDGMLADMLLTDPPYNIDYTGGTKDKLKIENDSWDSDDEFVGFLSSAFDMAIDNMRPGAAFYIWYADTQSQNFRNACQKSGMQVRQNLIWNKNTFALGRQDYQWKHEPCLYGWKEGAAHYFVDDRTQSTVFEDQKPDIKHMKKDEMARLLEEIFADRVSTTVLNEDKPSRSEEHPTMKPLKLMGRQIANSTKIGWLVLDLFGGSGSTMMACEQLGRRCFTMELDPHYCDVIIDRWQKLTGRTAVKL